MHKFRNKFRLSYNYAIYYSCTNEMIEPFTSYFEPNFLFNNKYAAILLRNSWLLFHKMRGPGGEQTRRLSTAVLFAAGPQTPGLRTAQGNAPGKAAHVTSGTAGLYGPGKAAHVTPRTAGLYGGPGTHFTPRTAGLYTARKAAHVTPGTARRYCGPGTHFTPRTAGLYGPVTVSRTAADGQSRRIRSDLLSASGLSRGAASDLVRGPLAALFWGPLAALFRSPLAGWFVRLSGGIIVTFSGAPQIYGTCTPITRNLQKVLNMN
jgi:hypothetical protein